MQSYRLSLSTAQRAAQSLVEALGYPWTGKGPHPTPALVLAEAAPMGETRGVEGEGGVRVSITFLGNKYTPALPQSYPVLSPSPSLGYPELPLGCTEYASVPVAEPLIQSTPSDAATSYYSITMTVLSDTPYGYCVGSSNMVLGIISYV